MASLYDNHDYYKKMLELQEKLRKSEEERIRLEERFKVLVQESRSRHDACINRLRLRYIEFLEEQRTRDERNHKLLGTLDRVDSSLALMTAKTARLNVLRKHYEAYLLRVYANRAPFGSVTGDSKVTNQSEDEYSRRNIIGQQVNLTPSEIKNTPSPQRFPNYQIDQSVSSIASILNQTMHNMLENHQSLEPFSVRRPGIVNGQPTNIPQNQHSRTHIDYSAQHFPLQNLTPQIYHNVQAYSGNTLQPFSQADPNLDAPVVKSFPQISPLHQQNISQFNKSKKLMETGQGTPCLLMSQPTNRSALQYKSADVFQNQVAPPNSQQYFSPSPIAQTHQQYDTKILDNTPGSLRNNDQLTSPALRTAPIPVESNLSRTLSETPLNSFKQVDYPLSYINHPLRNSHTLERSGSKIPTGSLTTSYIDDMIRRHTPYTPKHLNDERIPYKFSVAEQIPLDGNESGMISENDLDRYINKIKKLHRNNDNQSVEDMDHDENTSGDVLNVTLSDDALEGREDKAKEEQFPEEVEKVLALADDLASRTIDTDKNEEERNDEDTNPELVKKTQSVASISNVDISNTREQYKTSVAVPEYEIRTGVTPQQESDLHENDDKVAKDDSRSVDNILSSNVCNAPLSEVQENDGLSDSVIPSKKETAEEEKEKILLGSIEEKEFNEDVNMFYKGEESQLEQCSFDAVEELEPWNLEHVEKQIKVISLTDSDKDSSTEKNDIPKVSIPNDSNEEEIKALNEMGIVEDPVGEQKSNEDANIERVPLNSAVDQSQLENSESTETMDVSIEKDIPETRIDDVSTLKQEEEECANQNAGKDDEEKDVKSDVAQKLNEEEQCNNTKDEKLHTDVTNCVSDITQNDQPENDEYHTENQEYVEELKKTDYTQNPDQTYTDVNQEGVYDQSEQYEGNQEYQEYAGQEYPQESNEQYQYNEQQYDQYVGNPDIEYAHDPNAQYEQDPNAQYEQDPNAQYEQDPNAQYEQDPNAQYEQDPNQQYSYNYDQQYDPNQAYGTDPNQAYTYDDTYDPNQAENVQEQTEMQNEEYEKTEEGVESEKAENLAGEKSSETNKEQVGETTEPKKKKDIIKSLLDSDTESTIERNVSNTESDFDFN